MRKHTCRDGYRFKCVHIIVFASDPALHAHTFLERTHNSLVSHQSASDWAASYPVLPTTLPSISQVHLKSDPARLYEQCPRNKGQTQPINAQCRRTTVPSCETIDVRAPLRAPKSAIASLSPPVPSHKYCRCADEGAAFWTGLVAVAHIEHPHRQTRTRPLPPHFHYVAAAQSCRGPR